MMFDLLIFVTRFAGKKIKKPSPAPLGYFFLSGVNLWLQRSIKSGRTHTLFKISSKNLTSKQYITFVVIALTYYPGPWGFSWFFFFSQSGEIRVATRVNPFTGSLAALSCRKKSRKTSGNRVTTHRLKKDLFLNNPASSC